LFEGAEARLGHEPIDLLCLLSGVVIARNTE